VVRRISQWAEIVVYELSSGAELVAWAGIDADRITEAACDLTTPT
jgi:hypothetical protein